MRVLLVVSWYPNYGEKSSAGIFHYEQAVCLSQYCDVAIYFPFDQSLKAHYTREKERGIETYRTCWNGNALKRKIDLYKGFSKVIADFKPDVIHAQVASQAGYCSVKAGKKHKVPVIITEHNPIELMNLDNRKAYLRNKFAYHNSDANICVSNDSRNRLSTLFSEEKFETIYNGIIDPISVEGEVANYRKEDCINAAIVAGFYSKDIKGYQFLLPAIKEVRDKGTDITLHIIGGGEYEDHYKLMASNLGIEENCIFYGLCDREKVYSIVRQMDFNISASIFECSGVSVQEAMLLGKPLVVTKSGGANSLVTEETAIVVERNSTDALAEGISRMANEYRGFNHNAIRNYAFENFEIENVNKKYMELYEELIKRN